ncbi:hypothetical protein BIWAKO_06348 [Bosea sp. BIWAKO-01]|nr:hypothetical protein BIWAKO_06348 [Bosea sp. BIWAKO-01]
MPGGMFVGHCASPNRRGSTAPRIFEGEGRSRPVSKGTGREQVPGSDRPAITLRGGPTARDVLQSVADPDG